MEPLGIRACRKQVDRYLGFHAPLEPISDTRSVRWIAEHPFAPPGTEQGGEAIAIPIERARVKVKAKLLIQRSIDRLGRCPAVGSRTEKGFTDHVLVSTLVP